MFLGGVKEGMQNLSWLRTIVLIKHFIIFMFLREIAFMSKKKKDKKSLPLT